MAKSHGNVAQKYIMQSKQAPFLYYRYFGGYVSSTGVVIMYEWILSATFAATKVVRIKPKGFCHLHVVKMIHSKLFGNCGMIIK